MRGVGSEGLCANGGTDGTEEKWDEMSWESPGIGAFVIK